MNYQKNYKLNKKNDQMQKNKVVKFSKIKKNIFKFQ